MHPCDNIQIQSGGDARKPTMIAPEHRDRQQDEHRGQLNKYTFMNWVFKAELRSTNQKLVGFSLL